jgi:protein O-GlcNAc transferase
MDKRFVLAVRYLEAGLDGEAWGLVREMAAGPDSLDVLRLAATLRLKALAYDEALAFADRAVGLAPLDGAAWHLKARVHHLLADLAAAEAAFAVAVRIDGSSAPAWSDFGNVLADLGRPEEAAAAFRHAIAADPSFDAAHNNLGAVLASQGAFAAAAICYGEALRLSPCNHAARLNLGVAQLEQGDVATAIATFDTVVREAPQRSDAQDNRLYARLYTEEDPAVVAAEHRVWGAALPAVPLSPIADPDPDFDPGRRLRVGYVSPDLRRHAVATFLTPYIGAHDAAAVEVFCYADVVRPDAVTERLRSAADHWRQVHGWSDEALAARIEADRIDILVDLAGHTQGNRLGLFARRAAPIQVTALGYPATTGLATMDARFCDAVTDPPGAEGYASETLLRLLPNLHCYGPLPAPPPGPLPAQTAGIVTFGSFNKLAKISGATVRLWARVLRDLPASRLVVKSKPLTEDSTRAGLAARFAARGIDPARLTLSGWRPDDGQHMGLYGSIDIALDTFPYNGTTTTCEALWMGVPVLTLMGDGHAARVSASLLTAVELPDWIAETPAAFAALAVAKAADLPALAGLRAGLRERMRASSLCDASAHARGVEAAYRALWWEKIRGSSAG